MSNIRTADWDRETDHPQRAPEARDSYDARLTHILQTATQLIAREGYERASMRAVAQAARVSLAGLYHYFDSKEQMLFLIQFRAFTSLLNSLKEKLHGIEEPANQLCVMIRSHVEYFAANMDALKVCSNELDSLTGDAYETTLDIRREYYRLTRTIIDRILDAHSPGPNHDCHIATMSLFGTLNWLYRWYDPKKYRSPGSVARQVTNQFLYGLLGSLAPNRESVSAGPGSREETHQETNLQC